MVIGMNFLRRRALTLAITHHVLDRNISASYSVAKYLESKSVLTRLYSTSKLNGAVQWRSGLGMESGALRICCLRSSPITVPHSRLNQTKAGAHASQEETNREDPEKQSKDSKREKNSEREEKAEPKEEAEPPPPPPPHGNKSPFAVFYETIQKELKKSQEWQESTKAIADSAQQFTESPAVRRAREAYEASAKARAQAASKGTQKLIKTAKVVGEGAAWTWNTPVVKVGRTVVRKTGEGVAAVTKPMRETKVYQDMTKNVKEVIDDGSSSRYGGYLEKDERRKARELREKEIAKKMPPTPKMEEDPK